MVRVGVVWVDDCRKAARSSCVGVVEGIGSLRRRMLRGSEIGKRHRHRRRTMKAS